MDEGGIFHYEKAPYYRSSVIQENLSGEVSQSFRLANFDLNIIAQMETELKRSTCQINPRNAKNPLIS